MMVPLPEVEKSWKTISPFRTSRDACADEEFALMLLPTDCGMLAIPAWTPSVRLIDGELLIAGDEAIVPLELLMTS